ncbi:hypothetical protein DL768_004044 [Monosporascus sp. mg162]|nr:hypothetical protein DL768_004044 [Monosporascus sp. mg162]
MHNHLMPSTGMDQQNHSAHEATYSNEAWVDMNAYNPMAMTTYGGDYYIPPTSHGLPSESISGHMPPPPVPQAVQQQQHQQNQHQHHPHQQQHPLPYTNQLPHALIIPTQQPSQVPWPSLRINTPQNYSTAPVMIPAATAPTRQQPRVPSITTTTPRKTLTIQDRREMCKFHQENPHVKQTDIGLRFGVERSTVSKTLRYKERWLNYEERGGSPIQRTKGKSPPDIERALAVWVKGMQKKGHAFTDSQMEERAKVFCAGQESALKMITSTWLEKFKQKHGIGPGKLIRRASETAIPDSTHRLETESPLVSASQTPNGISPASPTGRLSPTTSSAHPDSKEALSGFMELEGSNYKHPQAQSTASLSSAVTDPPSSTFSGSAFSPTSQFTFSPDPNTGMFGDQNRVPSEGSNFHRPRSQTFPNLEQLEYINQPKNGESLAPKYSASGTAPSSALGSPAHEISAPSLGLDSSISSPALRRVGSSNSLGGRSTGSGAVSGTPIGSSPSSPTQEDARRAADTLLSFISSVSPTGMFDQNEYNAIVRLTEKLRLQHQQQQQQQLGAPKAGSSSHGLGGLSRIPEGDVDMTPPAHLNVKNEGVMTE